MPVLEQDSQATWHLRAVWEHAQQQGAKGGARLGVGVLLQARIQNGVRDLGERCGNMHSNRARREVRALE